MKLPLNGIRVLEMGHTVMGPTCGLVLADMGAEVIKIERAPRGDDTRRLMGFGRGFFPFYNRNKKSIVVDLKVPRGVDLMKNSPLPRMSSLKTLDRGLSIGWV